MKMTKERLQELAGVQLNENTNDVNIAVIKHIRDILVTTVKSDQAYFGGMDKEELKDQVEEMIVEQFQVLRDDLAPSILDSVMAGLK